METSARLFGFTAIKELNLRLNGIENGNGILDLDAQLTNIFETCAPKLLTDLYPLSVEDCLEFLGACNLLKKKILSMEASVLKEKAKREKTPQEVSRLQRWVNACVNSQNTFRDLQALVHSTCPTTFSSPEIGERANKYGLQATIGFITHANTALNSCPQDVPFSAATESRGRNKKKNRSVVFSGRNQEYQE